MAESAWRSDICEQCDTRLENVPHTAGNTNGADHER